MRGAAAGAEVRRARGWGGGRFPSRELSSSSSPCPVCGGKELGPLAARPPTASPRGGSFPKFGAELEGVKGA